MMARYIPIVPQAMPPAVEPCPINILGYDLMVMRLALRHGAQLPVRDSEQYAVGWQALLEAYRRFEPQKGNRFSTYAWKCVNLQLRSCRTSRRIGEPLALFQFSQFDFHIGPMHTEIYREEEMTDRVIADARRVVPAFDPASDDPGADLARIDFCRKALACLSERNREIIWRHIAGDITQEAAGAPWGLTRQRVNQIVAASLQQIRKQLGIEAPAEPRRPRGRPRVVAGCT